MEFASFVGMSSTIARASTSECGNKCPDRGDVVARWCGLFVVVVRMEVGSGAFMRRRGSAGGSGVRVLCGIVVVVFS